MFPIKVRFLGLLLACLGSVVLYAEVATWEIQPGLATRSLSAASGKESTPRTRHDSETISAFSKQEKTWLKTLFPDSSFRLFTNGNETLPDEYLSFGNGNTLSKDDFFTLPAGRDHSVACVFLLRNRGGLRAPHETEISAEEETSQGVSLDTLLYMDNPPEPETLPNLSSAQDPPPVPAALPRRMITGSVHFAILKPVSSTQASSFGPWKVLFRSVPNSQKQAHDFVRFRSFPLGEGLGFGVAAYSKGEGLNQFRLNYRLYSRGPTGIHKSWESILAERTASSSNVSVTRIHFQNSPDGSAKLLARQEVLREIEAVPAWEAFLPAVSEPASKDSLRGVVDVYQFKKGRFKIKGKADRAKGDQPVALRKNWPDYLARSSRGPPMLLSFGSPASPFETYLCPWPGHSVNKVPWVEDEAYLFKGKSYLTGKNDCSFAVWWLHDSQNLYLMVAVRDDSIVVPGDSIHLWLDARYGEEGLMFELNPGSPGRTQATVRVGSPAAKAGALPKVRVASKSISGGYWIEAAIPFEALTDLGMHPEGSLWGAAVNVVDVDDAKFPNRKTVLSTSKSFQWAKASSFNNLILE